MAEDPCGRPPLCPLLLLLLLLAELVVAALPGVLG